MHRLYLIGSVDDEAYEKFSKELRVLELKKVKAAELEIVSEGGDPETALAFYGRIIASPVKLTAIGHGLVQSAATLIYAACSRHLATPECLFFVHNTKEKLEGDYRDHNKKYNELRKAEIVWATLLGKHSKTPATQWLDWSDNETFLTTQEAFDAGLVDKILGLKHG